MGTFSRLRYVIAANVNALIEKAEDPEKLLRALIREMEDASEEARIAAAELLAEQQRLARLEERLAEDGDEWQRRAENAVTQGRDDLARAALKARTELSDQHEAAVEEQGRIAERIAQMEQDVLTLKAKLAESKARLKSMQTGKKRHPAAAAAAERMTPGERKMKRAMDRFDHLQNQVDNLEARVRSYEVGGSANAAWNEATATASDPEIERELAEMKQRIAGRSAPGDAGKANADEPAAEGESQA
jgi:phage shock protein A